jgi:N-formylglutamate amidohydrolase
LIRTLTPQATKIVRSRYQLYMSEFLEAGADIVLGDRYGVSCDPAFTEAAESHLRGLGYAVARNKPYAGGFITEHYGDPGAGWHALQIEINRGLYMDEATLERAPGFEELQKDLREVMQGLIDVAGGLGERSLAAE